MPILVNPYIIAAASGYDPFSTLPKAAFDAQETASLTLSGSNVTAWADLSGNGFNVTPDNTPPVYDATGLGGYPCLQISGGATSQRLISASNPLTNNQAYTKSVVLSLQDIAAISNTLTVGQSALLSQSVVGNAQAFHQGTFFDASSEAVVVDQVHVLTMRYGAGTGTNDLYIDDRLVATEAATSRSYTSGVLELFEYANNRAACKAGSFWLWDRRLDDTEIANFLDYQTARWGIIVGYDVIALGGQSNMVGINSGTAEATDTRIQQYGRYSPNVDVMCLAVDALDHSTFASGGIGMGRTFAKEYLATIAANRGVLLVPSAASGSNFKDGWQSYPSGAMYLDLVNRTNAAIALKTGNQLIAILWHQGESDNTLTQAQYATALDAYIDGVRADITGASSATPFICGELLQGGSMTSADIQAALNDTPNRKTNTACVSSTGLVSGGDNLHFSADSEKTFGSRYFTAYQSLI